MEEYTVITQGNAIYLEGNLDAEEQLDEVDRGMLVSNQIAGFLPLSIQWVNGNCRLLYNITGLTPLEQAARILEHETRLSNFFLSLCKAEKECDEYLLNPRKIDLEPKHVYLDAEGKAYVLYRPVRGEDQSYNPAELTHFVFRLVGQQMPQDSRVLTILSRQLLYGESFSFAELESKLKEKPAMPKRPEPVQKAEPKPAVEPPVQPKPQFIAAPAAEKPVQPEPVRPAVSEQKPVQDNPFAQGQSPFAAEQSEPKPKKADKKAEKKAEKEKKSGGLFGLFGGKKDKKKESQTEQESPFQQQAPEQPHEAVFRQKQQPVSEPAPAPAAGGRTVLLSNGVDGGMAKTTVMGCGGAGSGELYLVQKDTNQYIHVTHTNFHIGRAENIVDFTVQTRNHYLGNDHAYILLDGGNYYIVDNNTQNHTYLNEQRLEPSKPTLFHAGDTIRMADVVFSVVAGS